ncbi:MAG TPA: hypothetical protein VGP55_01470 [Chitinophagaceae bacterium]|nr:hypothetical protein [Chitinophagaceae bacterium]
MSKRILSVAFKAYQQHQAMLLPQSLDEQSKKESSLKKAFCFNQTFPNILG